MVTEKFSRNEWTRVVSAFDDLSLPQTYEYGEAKTQSGGWRTERAIFWENDELVGAAQMLIRDVRWLGRGLVWISRGPLWRSRSDAGVPTVLEILERLKEYWVIERGMYLRILPTLSPGDVTTELLKDHGFHSIDGSIVWTSSLVDLSLPLEVLRSRLQQKWRNCLNKAEKNGVFVESGIDNSMFRETVDEYGSMLTEKGFVSSITPELLDELQSHLPDERKLFTIVGRHEGQKLGGVLIARYGKTCEYLVGAVNSSGKAVNAGQLLLWSAISEMKKMGYRWFDLGGMDPIRTTKGVLHFKKGVNGSSYQLIGEIEAFNNSLMNHAIRWRIRRARGLA